MMSKEPTGRICEFGNRASSTQDSKRTKAIHIMSQSYRVHEDDFQTVSTGWSAALRSGELFSTEYRLRRSDGSWRTMIGRALPIRNSEGEIFKW